MLPSPTEDPDVQEAESRRYGDRLFMVLPLRSGRYAVLNRAFQVRAIVSTPDEAFFEGLEAIQSFVPYKEPPRVVVPALSLSDLGL